MGKFKMKFRKLSLIKKLLLPQEQLEQYYQDLRKYEYENNMPVRGITIRKRFHKMVIFLLKVECLFQKVKVEVVKDASKISDKPVIYASTHIGRYDVESNVLSHKEHFFALWGDSGLAYRNVDGLLLYVNGVICLDTDSQSDRMIGKETCIKLLKQGGNLLIYPEGAWNISENEPVMKLYAGAVEMAIRGGADIIPVAMENEGNHYYVNIGENIDYSNVSLEEKREKSDELRDILSTLKWDIWEKQGVKRRKDIPEDYADTFLNNIMNQSPEDYTVDDIIRTRFHGKETSPEEAFAYIEHLTPKKENAFLFRR
jgi:1-acyl-sn-glycerol-3-phosphate acyltransferase